MNPEIAIIIRHKNHECFLYEAIQSVLDQTYDNWKVYILNDGPNSLEDYEKIDPRIIVYDYLTNESIGIEKNTHLDRLNKVISLLEEPYITFLDADDTYPSWKLEASINFMKEKNLDFMWAESVKVWPDGKRLLYNGDDLENLKTTALTGFSTFVLTNKLIKSVPFTKEDYYSTEWFWMIKVLSKSFNFACLHVPTMVIRAQSSNYFNFYEPKLVRKYKRKWKNYKMRKQAQMMYEREEICQILQ
jgi:glycosyltransferase involved in cell wall biosynthesis